MKLFQLKRLEDESGVSGTGIVAEGVQFSNGKCSLSWLTKFTSVTVYDDIESLVAIHGHNGKTILEWLVDHRGEKLHKGYPIHEDKCLCTECCFGLTYQKREI